VSPAPIQTRECDEPGCGCWTPFGHDIDTEPERWSCLEHDPAGGRGLLSVIHQRRRQRSATSQKPGTRRAPGFHRLPSIFQTADTFMHFENETS
jgi:hypothetical protein